MGYKLKKLEYKLAPYAVRNLMTVIIGAMVIVYIANFAVAASGAEQSLYSYLIFDRAAIAAGQVWRVFTFIFMPPQTSLIFIIFALYFYWMMGSALEREWGALRFNVFYLVGIIGAIAAGLITGIATNSYLNMSLFLAFAAFYPNYTVMIFFILPVKVKWLAYIDLALLVYMFILNGWGGRCAILFSLVNVVIFFWRDMAAECKRIIGNIRYRIRTRRK